MKLIQKIDVSKHLANHLVGETHTIKHRRAFGTALILVGSIIGGFLRDAVHFNLFHILLDYTFMPSIHCLGAIPWLTQLENNKNSEK